MVAITNYSLIFCNFWCVYRQSLLMPGQSQTHCVAKDDFEFLIFLTLYPRYWDYSHMVLQSICVMLGLEPRPTFILGEHAYQMSYILSSFVHN